MRIASDDGSTVLEIELTDPADPYSLHTVAVTVQEGPSRFTGRNGDVVFVGFDEFLESLGEFLTTRKGSVVLEAISGGGIEIFPWNPRGDIGINARIPGHFGRTMLEVKFNVGGEFAHQIYQGFAQMNRG